LTAKGGRNRWQVAPIKGCIRPSTGFGGVELLRASDHMRRNKTSSTTWNLGHMHQMCPLPCYIPGNWGATTPGLKPPAEPHMAVRADLNWIDGPFWERPCQMRTELEMCLDERCASSSVAARQLELSLTSAALHATHLSTLSPDWDDSPDTGNPGIPRLKHVLTFTTSIKEQHYHCVCIAGSSFH
jgi:hypothetical protein